MRAPFGGFLHFVLSTLYLMRMPLDLSILIVHTFESRLMRQTIKSIRRAAPRLSFEIVVIDNNPAAGVEEILKNEFPDVRYLLTPRNDGFGSAMNKGIAEARGEYVLIFNPDIVVRPGSLEALHRFMEQNPRVGIVGPKLLNPDGTLQHSCSRYHTPLIPILRRTPLGRLPFGQRRLDDFLMTDVNHNETMNVDWLMGSALFTRRQALDEVGAFDEGFFMYFEDTDLCRRFWQSGWRVVYYPEARMVHYHRRASSDGNLFAQLFSPMTQEHMKSAVRFFRKYSGQTNPRERFEAQQSLS